MIPKKIHYCWFGRGPLPDLAIECIASWKKYLPEYELVLWNEDNFDLDQYPYARQAYDTRKFAYVTDVCRLHALYTAGGIYMDTDVEVLKPFDDYFFEHQSFSGFESNDRLPTGLMASVQGGDWVRDLLGDYEGKNFCKSDGQLDLIPNTETISNFMQNKKGILLNNTFQEIPDYCTMYPSDYFCPKNWATGELEITDNTYCIHHFAGSWLPNDSWRYKMLKFFVGKRGAEKILDYYKNLKNG